jgi:hypothetical protein
MIPIISISLDLDFLPGINYLLFHAHIPVIRKVTVKNSSSEAIEGCKIIITPSDEFAYPIELFLDRIEANGSHEISGFKVKLIGKFFASLTERMRGSWDLKLIKEDQVENVRSFDVELFAFDQWLGHTVIPELLTGFVLPNISDLVPITRLASEYLKKWSDSSSFDEYQSKNPNRVKTQIGAMYASIKNLNIIYQSTPASFGEMGQRVRLSDQVISQRVGNCLDLSLLFASTLESIGLNPILILIEGHAFVGCWLIEDTFPDSVNDDPSLLTKRIASGIHEIILLEATCLTEGNPASFDSAIELSRAHFMDLRKFHYFIDVKRTRFSGIYPLPQRKFGQDSVELIEDKSFSKQAEEIVAPSFLENGTPLIHVQEPMEWGKQKLWERKLLDLSLRNNLLNLRLSRSSIQFIEVPIGELEDSLFDGQEYQVLHKPKDWENTLRDEGIYQSFTSSSPLYDLVRKEFTQKRLRAYLHEEELNSRLTFLYRSARHSMEENGANTLYLAIGLLRWYESPRSEKARFAPIILIPVELIRKSVKVGYIIRGREEDAVLNITLLEKLRQDFQISISGLDPLPQDGSGVDVKAVFNIMRQAVMNQPRWDVEEQFFLGTFSFSKFILWNDIHTHTEELRKSPIVEGLLEGQLTQQLEILELENLDLHYKPSDILLPIPADSSQLEAVCSAVEGNSFILHGPPGTGKSQTITNIIANSLYRGKRVLFVAEKMAALSVVYSRLKSIGLDPFCLELHSNKARKAEVLSQLKKATEVQRKKTPQDFEMDSQRLDSLKSELDQMYQKLHQETFHGISLFEIFSKFIQLEGFCTSPLIADVLIKELEKKNFPIFEDFLSRLEKGAELAGNPAPNHPFYGVNLKYYSVENREQIQSNLNEYLSARKSYLSEFSPMMKLLGIQKELGWKERQSLENVLNSIQRLHGVTDELFESADPENLSDHLTPLIEKALKNIESERILTSDFDRKLLSLDAETVFREWKIKEQEWFVPRFFGLRKIRLIIQSYAQTPRKIANEQVESILSQIQDYQSHKACIDEASGLLQDLGIGSHFKSNEKLEELKSVLPELVNFHQGLKVVIGKGSELIAIKKKLKQLADANKKEFFSQIKILLKAGESDNNISSIVSADLGLIIPFVWNKEEEIGFAKATSWTKNIENLKEWHYWNTLKEEAKEFHLFDTVQHWEDNSINAKEIKGAILKEVYKKMANGYLKENPNLSVFSGESFESRISEFRRLNANFSKVTQEVLFAKLLENLPDFRRESSSSSETGILQKAIRSNGRGQSIRQLFNQIPNLLPRLTPCMLMSPISVAQYVDIHQDPFDMVIFDEASQLPTCEAVGAIARAKQIIIVGDPKQMPPTNFFSSVHTDEEDQNEDLESILEDCGALSVPSKQLRWHYRSKHESLIAFSNAKYYDNSLFTFPSPDDQESRVKFVKVDGIYDRGKTRQNVAEAKAIVNELVKRLQVPAIHQKSVGVVTFSSVQQTLIEDLLMEKFRQNPKLEEIALSAEEPYFIKNLENVQGDERDIILFSVCYGPDESGYVALNFGPLNRDGGWRRLNVAVSRARYEMIIYSTLTADQIDLNRSKAEGVAGLKAFLAFAEKGKVALPQLIGRDLQIHKSGLAQTIKDFLVKNGFQVDLGVGTSGFKVNLAIIDPDDPKQYLLGILLDTKSHESSKSSIDRLLVQESVLKLLGWEIIKVWSLDWWESSSKEGVRILNQIERIRNQPKLVEIEPILDDADDSVEENVEGGDEASATTDNGMDKYIYPITNLEKNWLSNSDDFLSFNHTQNQISQIQKIVETEGPILKSLVGKRILDAWGIGRMGGRLQTRMEDLYSKSNLKSTSDSIGNVCFWPNQIIPEEYSTYRVWTAERTKRNIDELPILEIINAMKFILQQQISLPNEDLVRETAKEFGFARTGNTVKDRMAYGIQSLIAMEIGIEENGRIKLLTL